MKKVFKLLLVLLICIGGNFMLIDSNAATLPSIDKEILDSKCVGCLKLEGLSIIDLENEKIPVYTIQITDECKECDSESALYYFYTKKMPYANKDSVELIPSSVERDCECNKERINVTNYPSINISNLSKRSDWIKVELAEGTYYVYSSVIKEEKTERKFFSLIDGKLNLITLDIEKINLYKNEECESDCENAESTSQIVESVGLSYYDFDNNMLVCKECSECDNCSEKVASNGSITEDVAISNFCPNHACAFIWDVVVSKNYDFENLTCKLEKIGGQSYCSTHKCGNCDSPVVGVNLNPFNTPIYYSGSNEFGYSNYCEVHRCYKVGCRAAASNSGAATKGYCNANNHINECVVPGCERIRSKKLANNVCDYHDNVLVTACGCGGVIINGECIQCGLDQLIDEDILAEDNKARNIICTHPKEKVIEDTKYIFISEHYHGIKIICTKCGNSYIKIDAHSDSDGNGICEVCLLVCRLLENPVQVNDGKMTFFIRDGFGKGGHMFFGGNGEMNSQKDTLNTMGIAAEGVEGKVIMATTSATGETRSGNNWKTGTNVQVTVDQVKESGIDHLHGYSSGSQLAIATASALIKEGNNQIEEVVIYDGFFAADTVPTDFENVLQSGTQVTFYWVETTGNADYYKTAAQRLKDWQKLYPNLNIIPLVDATHGNVVQKAQEYEGKEMVSQKCLRCNTISKTEVTNGYCASCWIKIASTKQETPPACSHSYDLTNKEYKWITVAYHQVKTICTKCKYTKADNEIHKDSNEDGICDLCKNEIAVKNNDDKDKNKCEHEYAINGYTFETVGFHKVNKVCSKCGEKTSESESHKDLDEDGNCDLCPKESTGSSTINKMLFYTIEGEGKESHMIFGGSDEMYSEKGTLNKFKSVLEYIDGKAIIATTTEKSDQTQYGQNWTKSTNIKVTVEQIKEAGVDHLQGYSSGSLITIAAASALAQEGNTQVKEIILYDGFYGIQYIPEDFETLLKRGTQITFYWTKEAAEMSRYKTVRSSVNKWAEEYSNLKLIEVEGATHSNIVEKSQEQL